MRASIVGLVLLCCPVAAALAQTPPAPPPASPAPAATTAPAAAPAPAATGRRRAAPDITRDEYVSRAVERAKRNAERRFDAMDANHDGTLTADERRAYRQAHLREREEDETAPASTPGAAATSPAPASK